MPTNPNRLLVTVTTEAGETYAEVAHEAIFRRWDKLRDWIAAEREFLAWRSGLEVDYRRWQQTPPGSKDDALLMGVALAQAQSWRAKRREDLPQAELKFIDESLMREASLHRRAKRARIVVYALLLGIITGLVGWINQSYIEGQIKWHSTARPFAVANILPYVRTGAAEQALKPGDKFRECAAERGEDYCPEMVVLPAGSFVMGSPPTEGPLRSIREGPQHPITISEPFAVSMYSLTFGEWDTCVAYGDCAKGVADFGWGRGEQPVINVSWDDAQRYVAWLSKMTGKPYRLLTEAEYEYAARAGTQTAYPWGDESARTMPTVKDAAANGMASKPRQWVHSPSTSSAYMTCSEMSGNGWRTAIISSRHPRTDRLGQAATAVVI